MKVIGYLYRKNVIFYQPPVMQVNNDLEKKTYRKRLEEDQALYDSLHGVAGQAESGAQMAPTLSDERRNTGRRLCGGGGGDQCWRLAYGGRRSPSHAGHHLADHVTRRPAAAHPHPPLQRLHQHTVVSGGDGVGDDDDNNGSCNIIRTTVVVGGDVDATLPSSTRVQP